jgi:hypothetical protein
MAARKLRNSVALLIMSRDAESAAFTSAAHEENMQV